MDLGLVSTVADSKETSSVPFSGKWVGKNQTWLLQACNCSSDKERNKQKYPFHIITGQQQQLWAYPSSGHVFEATVLLCRISAPI